MMGSRGGDALSTSWTPIDRVSPSSKYQPVSPSLKYQQPLGVARVSPASTDQLSYGSSSPHGTQARLVAHHGQVGTLRAGETYIPALGDWTTGLADFSAHPSEFDGVSFSAVTILPRIETQSGSAPGPPFQSKTPACSSLLQGFPC